MPGTQEAVVELPVRCSKTTEVTLNSQIIRVFRFSFRVYGFLSTLPSQHQIFPKIQSSNLSKNLPNYPMLVLTALQMITHPSPASVLTAVL